MQLKGLDNLERVVKQLPDWVLRKVTRQAVTAGTTPVLKTARQLVPTDSRTLKKSLTRKVKTYTKSMTVLGLVGPRAKAAPHGHLVENGSALRHQRSGKSTGRMPASRFMQRSLDENRTTALEALSAKMAAGVEREAKALGGGQ